MLFGVSSHLSGAVKIKLYQELPSKPVHPRHRWMDLTLQLAHHPTKVSQTTMTILQATWKMSQVQKKLLRLRTLIHGLKHGKVTPTPRRSSSLKLVALPLSEPSSSLLQLLLLLPHSTSTECDPKGWSMHHHKKDK